MFDLDKQIIKDFNRIRKAVKPFVSIAREFSNAIIKEAELEQELQGVDTKIAQLEALNWMDSNSVLAKEVQDKLETLRKAREKIVLQKEEISESTEPTAEHEDYQWYIINFGNDYGDDIIDLLEMGELKYPKFEDEDEKWAFWLLVPKEELERIKKIDPELNFEELERLYKAIEI